MSFGVEWLKSKYEAALMEAYYPLETRDVHQMLIDGVLSSATTGNYQETLGLFREEMQKFFRQTFASTDFRTDDLKKLSFHIASSDFLCLAEMVDQQGCQELESDRRRAYIDMVRIVYEHTDSLSTMYQIYQERMCTETPPAHGNNIILQSDRMTNLLGNLGKLPDAHTQIKGSSGQAAPCLSL
ncbi:MAG: hypothetical protein PHX61_08270 [Alphaproteobacteria bacterium]|nr:hypothetical protein [Alphaproteobacteria bacterium]